GGSRGRGGATSSHAPRQRVGGVRGAAGRRQVRSVPRDGASAARAPSARLRAVLRDGPRYPAGAAAGVEALAGRARVGSESTREPVLDADARRGAPGRRALAAHRRLELVLPDREPATLVGRPGGPR